MFSLFLPAAGSVSRTIPDLKESAETEQNQDFLLRLLQALQEPGRSKLGFQQQEGILELPVLDGVPEGTQVGFSPS